MTTREYGRWLRRVIVAYVADADDYTAIMDHGAEHCTDHQWDLTARVLADVDAIMVNEGVGTPAQVARVARGVEGVR